MLENELSTVQSQTRVSQETIRPWLLFSFLFVFGILVLLSCGVDGLLAAYLLATNRREQQAAAAAEAEATALAIAITGTAEALAQLGPIPTTTPLVPPTPTPSPRPSSCAMLRAQAPGSADGDYTLYLSGVITRPATLYCHNMEARPVEFLTLANTGGGFNYGLISYPEGALMTHYQKLRLDPATLTVDTADRTFATSQAEVPGYSVIPAEQLDGYAIQAVDYAWAEGCHRGDAAAPVGRANIDLNGTDFALSQSVSFAFQGVEAQEPVIDVSQDRRVVNLAISGRCAHIQPGAPLRLVYIPTASP